MENEPQESVEQLCKERRELQDRIREQDDEIRALKEELYRLKDKGNITNESNGGNRSDEDSTSTDLLSAEQIERYSRQLLLNDGFGVQGQRKLLSSSVLVIGAGGIGSTGKFVCEESSSLLLKRLINIYSFHSLLVLLYLAAAGVGKISIVDFDTVDRSNLHRQVIHKDENFGMNKAVSACRAVKNLNPSIECIPIQQALTHENALDFVANHDIVVDASDNSMTRYLVNDACVLANKPLVSGSAIGTEGQLSVYNHDGGPCYRCLYPKPNSTEGCKSCSDNGVLGPVPGLIGILQSVEVLKVLTGIGTTMKDRLLMYDSLRCSFINIKKPPRSLKCPACGDEPTITSMKDSWSVAQTCRGPRVVEANGDTAPTLSVRPTIPADQSISCTDYKTVRDSGKPHVLLDVRVPRQFEMCSPEGAVNIPLEKLSEELDQVAQLSSGSKPVYCLCRRGIFSVEATRILSEASESHPDICTPKNIRGGLQAWSKEVDTSFPKY